MLSIYALFLCFSICKCITDPDDYYGPPYEREKFKDKQFVIYLYHQPLSWEDAFTSCESANLSLILVDSPEKAKFVAESIAEAWIVLEDLWIGARKKTDNEWKWEYTNEIIPREPKLVEELKYMYPPWLQNIYPSRTNKDCLAVDRYGHDIPLFVDLPCTVPRPYICEKNSEINVDEHIGGSVETSGYVYVLYHGRLNWAQAVAYCRQQGQLLATVPNITIAKHIAKKMLKSRPVFENAWIGAHLQNNMWVWVANGEEIEDTAGSNLDLETSYSSQNDIETAQFPPWFEPQHYTGECALLDRHLCKEPVFIAYNCNRQRDFICMYSPAVPENKTRPTVTEHKDKKYLIFQIPVTWHEGKAMCESYTNETYMLTLSDLDETDFVMRLMSDDRTPIKHLWIAGYLNNSKWWWVERDNQTEIPIKPNSRGFPPWCDDDDVNKEMPCLNLDRENHWTPLIYGLNCNFLQNVVCVSPKNNYEFVLTDNPSTITTTVDPNAITNGTDEIPTTTAINEEVFPAPNKDIVPSKGDIVFSKPLVCPPSSCNANYHCKRDVGSIFIPNFNSATYLAQLYNIVKKHLLATTTTKEMVYIDGKFNAKKDVWVTEGGMEYRIQTTEQPKNGDCLIGVLEAAATQWSFVPVNCLTPLSLRIFCASLCYFKALDYRNKTMWNCESTPSQTFDRKLLGMTCSRVCADDEVFTGPGRYICQEKGWTQVDGPSDQIYGGCVSVDDGLLVLNEINANTTSVVLVTEAGNISKMDAAAVRFFIGNLADFARVKNSKILVHAISMEQLSANSGDAIMKLKNYTPSTDCTRLRIDLLNILLPWCDCVRNFEAALSLIDRSFNADQLATTVVVFVLSGGNQVGDYIKMSDEINTKTTVFAIGTNSLVPINQLVQLSTKRDSIARSIRFQTEWDIVDSSRILVKHCTGCRCQRDYEDSILHKGLQ